MNTERISRARRRALVLSALVGTLLAAMLSLAVGQAQAAYTARVQGSTLKITGDKASDMLVLRLAPGSPTTLQVDVGADGTADFSFDRTTFTAIEVEAGPGDDQVRLDQINGAFTDEAITLNGGPGNDTLLGGAGVEKLIGGGGDDLLDGNQGVDQVQLGGGSDRFQWDPGDGSDLVDGQAGDDTLDFNGSNIGEQIDVSANGSHVRFFRDIANIALDLNAVEHVGFDALGGADTVIVNDLAGTDATSVDVDLNAAGGGGDAQPDIVGARGTEGADAISVGSPASNVLVSGLAAAVQVAGSELAFDNVNVYALGGDDTVSSGVGISGPEAINVYGGPGTDTTSYNGTPAGDEIAVVANGTEPSVFAVAPDAARVDSIEVESLDVLTLAGADLVSSTGNLAPLTALTIDGGEGGDELRGGNGADLLIGGGGDDLLDGNQGVDQVQLGGGSDRFQWDPGDGSDLVDGQAGDDTLDFNGSNIGEQIDVSANGSHVRFFRDIANIALDLNAVEHVGFDALGGADTVIVNDLAGTDATSVDVDLNAAGGGGDAQPDIVGARGTEGADAISVGSPASNVLVSGLAAAVQVAGSELAFDNVNVYALGGDDTVSSGVGISGPEAINVYGGPGTDTTSYNGTPAGDEIAVVANGTEPSVFAVAPDAARVDSIEVESLDVLTLAGADLVSSTGNLAPLTALTIDGGEGGDELRGGNGADLLIGGGGDDLLDGNQGVDQVQLGGGSDRFQWDPGDGSDLVDGQAGDDTLDFNGSNIGEQIDVSANGSHVRFFRDIANIALDLNAVEHVGFDALGGADTVIVNDLAGTDATSVDVDLNAAGGGGDAQPDIVGVNGTEGPDVVDVTRSGSQVLTGGLAAETTIVGSEPIFDTLLIQTLGGNDDVTVAPDVGDLIMAVVDLGDDE